MQLKHEMDRLRGHSATVVVIASVIELEGLHPELRQHGRFDYDVPFEKPDRDERLDILRIHTRKLPLAAGCDLGTIAWKTEGRTGAELAHLCERVALSRLRGWTGHQLHAHITTSDFERLLAQVNGRGQS